MFLLQCLSKVAVFCLLVALFACEAENSLESDRAEPTTAFAIEHLFIPEMAPGSHTGVAYLRIRNNTAKALSLNYVHSQQVSNIEVHRHIYDNGMMSMRPVPHLMVPPNSVVDFSPGALHLMLFGVERAFQQGEQVALVFEFEGLPAQTVMATVKRR